MTDLIPVFTTAGLRAIESAQGMSVVITHVALGDQGSAIRDADGLALDDARAKTELNNELARNELSPSSSSADGQVILAGEISAAKPEFFIKEIGYFSDQGILIAYWSSADGNLGYRSDATPWTFRFALKWSDLPATAITVSFDSDSTLHRLGSDVDGLGARITALEGASALGDMNSNLDELDSRVSALESDSTLSELSSDVGGLGSRVSTLESDSTLSELSDNVGALGSRMSTLEGQLNSVGSVKQIVTGHFPSYWSSSGVTTSAPPSGNQGGHFLTLAITPKSSSSKLIFEINASCVASNNNNELYLFVVEGSTIMGLSLQQTYSTNIRSSLGLSFNLPASGTHTRHFQVRIGIQGGGTLYVNGYGSKYPGCGIHGKITEI